MSVTGFPKQACLLLFASLWPPLALSTVTISGLDEELEANARALMRISSATCETAEWRVERLFRDSDEELQNALEALGHYRFVFEKKLSFEGDCWVATYDVRLEPPVLLDEVRIQIVGDATDDSELNFSTSNAPTTGDRLHHGRYESYKRSVLTSLAARGYFDARLIENSILVDENLQFADLSLRIESGPRYRFGAVEFQTDILRPELLAGYVRFDEGQPYSGEEITKLHELLSGSGYFGSVSITAEPTEGDEHIVPVTVAVTPAKRRAFTAGVGYATDTGIQGRLGYANRRRNDRGHQFDARLFLSSVESELTGTYRWPRGRPDAEWVDLYGGFLRKRTDTSLSDKTTLGLRVARNRSENWLETPYLDFSYEDFLVGDQQDSSTLVMPGIKWESTIGRDLKRVPNGKRVSIDVRGAHESLLSDTTFAQATASAKWIWSVMRDTRLLLRGELGTTATDDFESLPATVRFFAGGDTSVRGYAFESIGPVDAEDNVTGGEHLAVFSLEADWTIRGNWGVAAFADTGSAFNDTDIELKTGLGLGLRWYSPLGPIRLDVAHPLDDPETAYRIHVTLGPDL